MGSVLPKGGPAGLFIGFMIWGFVMVCVNECFGKIIPRLGVNAIGWSLIVFFFSGNGMLCAYFISIYPTRRTLGGRCIEFRYGMEFLS